MPEQQPQAGSFGEAKNRVVLVPPAPGEVDPLVVLTSPDAMATYMMQVSEHKQAAQHNVDVMNGYTGASLYNTERQPTTFGELVNDQAGITVESPATVDSADFRESTSDSGSPGSVPWPGSGGDAGYRSPVGGDGGSGARPDTASARPGRPRPTRHRAQPCAPTLASRDT